MAEKKSKCYSGIGGQAVLEGVMMRNGDKYAVAVRKPDGNITVNVENYQGTVAEAKVKNIPFVRGVFNFINSITLGTKVLNFSSSFYEEEEDSKFDRFLKKILGEQAEKIMTGFITLLSVAMAVGIFILIPYLISSFIEGYLQNRTLVLIIEGVIRIAIFLLYAGGISLMKDIRRLYQYHGAEHKCINCIERGRPLTVNYVMRSSRMHKRCGTSFIFFVMVVSIILFFFIRVDVVWQRALLRILLMPVVAGISYELIRLAGRSDNIIVRILSAPGMLIQRLTTREPDEEMVEVAIASVEAIFDWKAYLKENFGMDVDDDGEGDL